MSNDKEPRVVPFLNYEDGVAALDWLVRAFGFVERTRILTADGRLSHGELETPGGGLLMLASTPAYVNSKHLAQGYEPWRRAVDNPWVIDGVLVYVDDLDVHFARAEAEGATILRAPESTEHGRLYSAEDPEGHRWMFMQA